MTTAETLREAARMKTLPDIPISRFLSDNLALLDEVKKTHADLIVHPFPMYGRLDAALAYIEGIADGEGCGEFILRLLLRARLAAPDQAQNFVQTAQTRRARSVSEILPALFNGCVALFAEGDDMATLVEIRSSVGRGISEPQTDRSVHGPHEGFVEKIVPNLAILRRKLRDTHLCVENAAIGRRGNTRVCVLYVDDIADPTIVATVKHRLSVIDVDALTSLGQLTQYLEDAPPSPFPQILSVERADMAADALLEGRVVVIMDQLPRALILPALFIDFFRSADDRTDKAYIGTAKRALRIVCFLAGVLLPGWYVALMTYHAELIPLSLLLPILQYRASVALPIFAEVLLVEVIVTILAEAALRTPSQMSQTIGLVGGVILGQALLSSRLATPSTLVVATASIIAQYAMPSYVITRLMALLRLLGIAAAALAGLFGMTLLWIVVIFMMIRTRPCGVPYTAPFTTSGLTDAFGSIRVRRAADILHRGGVIPVQDDVRQVKHD